MVNLDRLEQVLEVISTESAYIKSVVIESEANTWARENFGKPLYDHLEMVEEVCNVYLKTPGSGCYLDELAVRLRCLKDMASTPTPTIVSITSEEVEEYSGNLVINQASMLIESTTDAKNLFLLEKKPEFRFWVVIQKGNIEMPHRKKSRTVYTTIMQRGFLKAFFGKGKVLLIASISEGKAVAKVEDDPLGYSRVESFRLIKALEKKGLIAKTGYIKYGLDPSFEKTNRYTLTKLGRKTFSKNYVISYFSVIVYVPYGFVLKKVSGCLTRDFFIYCLGFRIKAH